MCRVTTCLILATLGIAPTAAQQSETHRLLAETLDLTQSPAAKSALKSGATSFPRSSPSGPSFKTPFQAST